jgi:hypothetical protein
MVMSFKIMIRLRIKILANDKVGTTLDDKNDNVNDHGETDEDDHDGSITNPDNFDLALVQGSWS